MAQKVKADKLDTAIRKALQEYAEDETVSIKVLSRTFAKKGAQAVKNAAKSTFGGTGEYAKGWTSTFEEGRYSAQGIIHNKAVPGLPHLLEHGHANRGGGRTPGRVHIAPVEEKLVSEFEKAVRAEI